MCLKKYIVVYGSEIAPKCPLNSCPWWGQQRPAISRALPFWPWRAWRDFRATLCRLMKKDELCFASIESSLTSRERAHPGRAVWGWPRGSAASASRMSSASHRAQAIVLCSSVSLPTSPADVKAPRGRGPLARSFVSLAPGTY